MLITLQNKELLIEINSQGAELQRVFHNEYQLDYMWNADPAFWSKRSPVLFPIVGQLKDNSYQYKGHNYHLPRHGFAREKEFMAEHVSGNEVTFLLLSNEDTLQVYPFDFEFRIHYSLRENTLNVCYDVFNTGRETMYFSVGGHPAFKVPLVANTTYTDYYLELEQMETIDRLSLQNGLLDQAIPLLHFEKHIPLSHQLFHHDAIVLKNLKSNHISLKSDKTPHGLNFNFEGFPYLGIWAAKDADFVCIEPWHGIADSITHNGLLQEKEGILKSEPGHRWQDSWELTLF